MRRNANKHIIIISHVMLSRVKRYVRSGNFRIGAQNNAANSKCCVAILRIVFGLVSLGV
jgi:hypothetical protein